jgi:foldase protein PrsA
MSRSLCALLGAALLLSACGADDIASSSAATVNGKEIPASQISEALDRFEKTAQFDQLAQQSGERSARRQFEQAYLAQQIRRAVLAPEAEALGVQVTQPEIDQELDKIKANFPSEQAFQKALEERGFTLDQVTDLVRDQLLEQKIQREVTAGTAAGTADVHKYYDSHMEDYRQTKVQHILVKKLPRARDIAERLHKAPKKKVPSLFAELAKKYSEDASNAKDAGKLGWVSASDLDQGFVAGMEDVAVGAISDPVQSQYGYHVIFVTGRRVRPLNEVRADIESQLSSTSSEAAYRKWLADAYRDADVEVDPRYGELDLATGQIVNASAGDVPGADESSQSPAG